MIVTIEMVTGCGSVDREINELAIRSFFELRKEIEMNDTNFLTKI